MKRVLLILFCVSSPSWATIAISTSTSAGSSGGASATTTAIDTTGANFCVIGMSYYSAGGTCVPSDNKSNAWTNVLTYTNSGYGVRIDYSTAPVVGSGHTFTATTAAATYPEINVMCFSGVAGGTALDSNTTGNNNFGTTVQTGSLTPTNANELLITQLLLYNVNGVPLIDSGFTAQDYQNYSGGNHLGGMMAYQIQTTATARNPTWNAGGTNFLVTLMADFIAGTGGAIVGVNKTIKLQRLEE